MSKKKHNYNKRWRPRSTERSPQAASGTLIVGSAASSLLPTWGVRGYNTTKRQRRHEEFIKVPTQQRHLEFYMVAELWSTQLGNDIGVSADSIRHQDNDIRVRIRSSSGTQVGNDISFRFCIRMIGQQHQIQGQSVQLTTPRWPLGRPPRGHNSRATTSDSGSFGFGSTFSLHHRLRSSSITSMQRSTAKTSKQHQE